MLRGSGDGGSDSDGIRDDDNRQIDEEVIKFATDIRNQAIQAMREGTTDAELAAMEVTPIRFVLRRPNATEDLEPEIRHLMDELYTVEYCFQGFQAKLIEFSEGISAIQEKMIATDNDEHMSFIEKRLGLVTQHTFILEQLRALTEAIGPTYYARIRRLLSQTNVPDTVRAKYAHILHNKLRVSMRTAPDMPIANNNLRTMIINGRPVLVYGHSEAVVARHGMQAALRRYYGTLSQRELYRTRTPVLAGADLVEVCVTYGPFTVLIIAEEDAFQGSMAEFKRIIAKANKAADTTILDPKVFRASDVHEAAELFAEANDQAIASMDQTKRVCALLALDGDLDTLLGFFSDLRNGFGYSPLLAAGEDLELPEGCVDITDAADKLGRKVLEALMTTHCDLIQARRPLCQDRMRGASRGMGFFSPQVRGIEPAAYTAATTTTATTTTATAATITTATTAVNDSTNDRSDSADARTGFTPQ